MGLSGDELLLSESGIVRDLLLLGPPSAAPKMLNMIANVFRVPFMFCSDLLVSDRHTATGLPLIAMLLWSHGKR
jgi:hypothetical protein